MIESGVCMWFREISPRDAIKQKNRFLFVDIRSTEEYEKSHIKGAIHIPYERLENKKELPLRGKEIVVYCQLGTLGIKAVRILESLGYRAFNLSGGFRRWNGERD